MKTIPDLIAELDRRIAAADADMDAATNSPKLIEFCAGRGDGLRLAKSLILELEPAKEGAVE